jgi:hypothetical protein
MIQWTSAEDADQAVSLLTCIREMPSLIICSDTNYPDRTCHCFLQFLYTNSRTVR